jgi:hypothetical protein
MKLNLQTKDELVAPTFFRSATLFEINMCQERRPSILPNFF